MSNKLRDSARGQACQLRLDGCNGGDNNETVVLAHLPNGSMGKKSLDIHAFFCCHSCHEKFDHRDPHNYDRDFLGRMGLEAMRRTQAIWVHMGLLRFDGE